MIIIENLQIMFPQRTLDLRSLSPDERELILTAIKREAADRDMRIMDAR